MWSLADQTYNRYSYDKLETQASGFMLNLLSNVPINTSTLYHICTADAQPHSPAIHTFFLVLEAFLHSVWSWTVKTNISWIVFEGLIWPEGNIAICGHKNNLTQIHYPPSHSQKELQIHRWVSLEVQTHKMFHSGNFVTRLTSNLISHFLVALHMSMHAFIHIVKMLFFSFCWWKTANNHVTMTCLHFVRRGYFKDN